MPRRLQRPPPPAGFTLIELMTAVAVSAIIVAVALSLYFTVTASLRRQGTSRREEALRALDVLRRDLACALPSAVTAAPPFALEVVPGAYGGGPSNADLTLTTATLENPEAPLAQLRLWRVRYRLVDDNGDGTEKSLQREAVRLDAPMAEGLSPTTTLFRAATAFEVSVLAGTAWQPRWRPGLRAPVPGAVGVRLGWRGAVTTETAEAWTVIPAGLPFQVPGRHRTPAPPVRSPTP